MDKSRFWAKVDKSAGPEGCWIWTGYTGPNGYGYCNSARTGPLLAHRVAYTWEVEPLLKGYELHHVCEKRSCVNPAHLRPVTTGEHMRLDGRIRSRAKLTQEQVDQIRGMVAQGSDYVQVARQFGVDPTTVGRAVRRATWSDEDRRVDR